MTVIHDSGISRSVFGTIQISRHPLNLCRHYNYSTAFVIMYLRQKLYAVWVILMITEDVKLGNYLLISSKENNVGGATVVLLHAKSRPHSLA